MRKDISIAIFVSIVFSACSGGGGSSAPAKTVDPNAHKFIISVKTDNIGKSLDNQFEIQIDGAGYAYSVDCDNDGTKEVEGETNSYTCEYATEGNYTIAIEGIFPQIVFEDTSDNLKLLEIKQWGTGEWRSMRNAFFNCSNMTLTATDTPNLSHVTDMYQMFRGATLFDQDISNWDVSNVEDMTELFAYIDFNQDIGNWNVSNVTIMYGMFNSNRAFNQDITRWDVQNVEIMTVMFIRADSFNQNIGLWNVGSVQNMSYMFHSANAFDQNIGEWDIQNVTNMTDMFKNISLSGANYDALLVGWERNGVQNGVVFNGGGSQYSTGAVQDSRQSLIDANAWTITDGGTR